MRRWRREERKKNGKKFLLAEYEGSTLYPDNFFAKALDMAEQMGGDDYYVELPEERYSCGYLCDFDNFKKTRNSRISLAAAYNAENFLLGISQINSGINNGSLVIPNDSIIHAQLQDITPAGFGGEARKALSWPSMVFATSSPVITGMPRLC